MGAHQYCKYGGIFGFGPFVPLRSETACICLFHGIGRVQNVLDVRNVVSDVIFVVATFDGIKFLSGGEGKALQGI